jgi:hypothetical protein
MQSIATSFAIRAATCSLSIEVHGTRARENPSVVDDARRFFRQHIEN